MSILLLRILMCYFFFFFFQAEDGIRDLTVTGVQTCALPISRRLRRQGEEGDREGSGGLQGVARGQPRRAQGRGLDAGGAGADVARPGGAAGRRGRKDFPADPDRAHWRNRFGAGQRAVVCGGERGGAETAGGSRHTTLRRYVVSRSGPRPT